LNISKLKKTKYLTLLGYVYSGCIHGIIAKKLSDIQPSNYKRVGMKSQIRKLIK
jgi:hypothetical protein